LIHCVNHAGALSLVYCDITVQASYKFACFRSGIGRRTNKWRSSRGGGRLLDRDYLRTGL